MWKEALRELLRKPRLRRIIRQYLEDPKGRSVLADPLSESLAVLACSLDPELSELSASLNIFFGSRPAVRVGSRPVRVEVYRSRTGSLSLTAWVREDHGRGAECVRAVLRDGLPELREDQRRAALELAWHLCSRGGAVLAAPTGWGKTKTAAALARALERAGVIREAFAAVPRAAIEEQWREEGIEAATAQRIYGELKLELGRAPLPPAEGFPIPLSALLLAYGRGDLEKSPETSVREVRALNTIRRADLIIIDEIHNVREEFMAAVLALASGKMVLGLSATPELGHNPGQRGILEALVGPLVEVPGAPKRVKTVLVRIPEKPESIEQYWRHVRAALEALGWELGCGAPKTMILTRYVRGATEALPECLVVKDGRCRDPCSRAGGRCTEVAKKMESGCYAATDQRAGEGWNDVLARRVLVASPVRRGRNAVLRLVQMLGRGMRRAEEIAVLCWPGTACRREVEEALRRMGAVAEIEEVEVQKIY